MKNILFSNIWLKVLSIILAFSLWFFVTYRGQSELSIDVPIEFKNLPAGLEIVRQNVRTTGLNISGHERMLKDLHPKDVRVAVDMSGAKKGEAVYYFDTDNVIMPGSIKVLRIDPSSVKVTVDESVVKVLPVKAPVIGSPEKGYRVTSINIAPTTVEVEGPAAEMSRTTFLRTEPVDITGLDTGITQDAHINTNGRNIRLKKQDIAVTIRIERVKK